MKRRTLPFLLILLAVLFTAPIHVHASDIPSAESISFYCHNRTGYLGLSDILNIYFSPDGAEEAYTMTSSDESVVRLEWSVLGHYTAYYLKPGTAVITVTSESGLTDQCTITVMEMESFELNETKTVTIHPWDVLTFEFKYKEYGDYVFFSTDDVGTPLKSETKDANIYYNLNRHYFTIDQNSEFCRLSIYNDTEAPQTYTVKLMKAVPVESITLDVSTPAPYYTGDSIVLKAKLHPENAKSEKLTWISGNTSIVDLDAWGRSCYIDCLSAGKSFVTVTSTSGATATIEISVIEPSAIYDDCTFDISLKARETIVYSFTPKETGEYVLYRDWDEELSVGITIINANTKEEICITYNNPFHSSGCEYSFKYFYLDSNSTYLFRIKNKDGDRTASTTYRLCKTVPIEKMYFDVQQCSKPFFEGWGSIFSINLIIEPIHAEYQQFSWKIDNENIVTYRWPVSEYDHYAVLECKAPGNAILTASSNSGLSTTCQITVYQYQDYVIVSGDKALWKQNSKESVRFEVNADPEKFVCMWFADDRNEISPNYYSITKGNTDNSCIIVLHPDALKSLPLGTHYINVNYSDGDAIFEFTVAESSTTNPFTDVPSGAWFETPVLWALENGVTTGTSDTTFSPDDQCLRSHVMSFLWRAAGSPEPTSYNNSFSDVSSSDWFYPPVLWAVEQGITSGVAPGRFGANDICSRYQVVFFLWKAAGSPEPTSTYNPFSDVKSTDFFYNAVLWAVENKITAGISPTEFGTYAPCTRAQVMTFLYNAYT